MPRFYCLAHSMLLPLLFLASCSDDTALTHEEEVSQLVDKITWLESTHPYGHTALKIQTDENVIYLDPVDLVSISNQPKADLLLISHNHADHYSPETIAELSTSETSLVSIDSIVQNTTGVNAVSLTPGETVNMNGLEIQGTTAYNASHAKGLNYLGFLFSIGGVRIYLSGDTSFNDELKSLTDIDVAVLNVRNPYSMTAAEVVEFAQTVKPTVIIPIHWMPENDTYQDAAEIEFITANMPDDVTLKILSLK